MTLTYFIIGVTVIVSVLAFKNAELFNKLKFNAYMVWYKKDVARLFGHGLLHADWMHLGMNMFVLYFFGGFVESGFVAIAPTAGKFLFMFMYLLAIPAATIPSLIKYKNLSHYNSVGASGAVAAVLFASILFAPQNTIYVYFIPMKSYIAGVLYVAYSYYMGKRKSDNIAHDAHLAGAVFGFIFPLFIRPDLIFRFFNQIFG